MDEDSIHQSECQNKDWAKYNRTYWLDVGVAY